MSNRDGALLSRPAFVEVGQICLGVAVVALLLLFPPAPYLTEALQGSGIVALMAVALVSALLYSGRGAGRETLQAVAIFALFAIPLIYKWQFAPTAGNLIGGLVPWKDASNYYYETLRLLDGVPLSEWGARRPLFASFFSSLLRLNGASFSGALVVLLLLNAFAALVVSRVIARRYGATGAAIYVVVAYTFYARFAGTPLSEQLGFLLGNLAMFCLLAGVETKRFRTAALGLALLTLALNARAGAFFILPVLVVWLSLEFRQTITRARSVAISTVIVCAIVGLNLGFVRLMSGAQGAAFSNYPQTLYGIAAGNKSWKQISIDHPGVPDREILPLAIEKIKSEPALFVKGMLASCLDFLAPRRGAFGFIKAGQFQVPMTAGLWLLVVLGAWHAVACRMRGADGFALASLLGVAASLPLLPPIDSDGMRVFAATIPFSAIWIATGASRLAALAKRPGFETTSGTNPGTRVPFANAVICLSAAVVVLGLVVPGLARAAEARMDGQPGERAVGACGKGENLVQGLALSDASVSLVPDAVARESWLPYVRESDFRSSLKNGQYPQLVEGLAELPAGVQLSLAMLNESSSGARRAIWLVSGIPAPEGDFSICARPSLEPALQGYQFHDADRSGEGKLRLTFSQRHPGLTSGVRVAYGLAFLAVVVFLVGENVRSKLIARAPPLSQ